MTTDTPILYDVFISYARADGRDLAERLYLALKDRGLRPWRDERDLNPYQDFSVGIERAIRASRYVVVLLTPQIAERDDSFVRREILEAQSRHKSIIPLITPGFDAADVPIIIKHLTYLNFTDFDAHLPDLLNRLSEFPGGYEPPALPDDPFRAYVERLRDFVVGELEVSLLNIHDLILLRAKDTPDAVGGKPPPPLPAAFRSRAFQANERTSAPPPERDFDDFNAGFAAHNGRLLLLGEPGAGKTTTLLAFTREKAIDRLTNPIAPLPIYAPLSSWDGKSELADWLASATGLDSAALRREIAANHALLILDGLDEMASAWRDPDKEDAESRDLRLEFLEQLKPLDTAALISCRVKDYDDIVAKGGDKIALNGAVTLQPLSDEQIKAYLHDQPELWDALQSDPALLDMARTPLLLTLLAIGYRDSTDDERAQLRDLSASPGDLRDRIFETYVRKRYEHEEMRTGEKLPYELQVIYEKLGCAAMWSLNDLANNLKGAPAGLFISSYLEKCGCNTREDLNRFLKNSVQLHILNPIPEDRIGLCRFPHLLLRDHFILNFCLSNLTNAPQQMKIAMISSLGEIADPRAFEPLIAALSDPDARVRSRAALVLGNLTDSRAVEPLLDCLSDNVGEVRRCAAVALGRITDPQAVKPLIYALYDDMGPVRASAATALGRIGDLRAVEPLIDSLGDGHNYVVRDALKALVQLADPQVVEKLINILTHPDDAWRLIAINALGEIADPRAVGPLKGLLSDTRPPDFLDDDDKRVCDYAAEALTRIGTPEALAAVEAWRREQGNNPQQ